LKCKNAQYINALYLRSSGMASLSKFFCRMATLSLWPLLLTGLFCFPLHGAANAKTDRWATCRGGEPDLRIASCTDILARGSRETKSHRIAAFLNRSSAYRAKGDLDRAIADLDNALQLNPKSPLSLTNRASAYQAKGDLDRAAADYTAVIALKPKSAAAFLGRAEIYRAKGELDCAIADYGTALRLDNKLAAAYAGRAKAYRAKQNLDKALADFDKSLMLDPKSAALHLDRGEIYEAKGDIDDAIADYGQAITQDPKLSTAYNARGLAFSAKGDFERALGDFSEAVTLDPAFADAFFNRAKAHLGKHDLEHARQDLQATLALGTRQTGAKEALDKVNELLAASATQSTQELNHQNLPWSLALPFAGMLLSIALGPLVVKEWWHIHYEKAAVFWAALTIAGLVAAAGPRAALAGFVRSMTLEYVPFILMLFALYTAAGGIAIKGKLRGAPLVNTMILGFGTLTASLIGTTGASMILIRPLLRANRARRHHAHVVVFFIFLVSNIGGVLTPLGDPPLFLGFLEGIDFFWTARTLWPHALFAAGTLLVIFFLLDSYLYRSDPHRPLDEGAAAALRIDGLANIALIGAAVGAIIVSGLWRPGIGFEVLGTRIELQNLARELAMVLTGLASLWLTHPALRAANDFDWEPIREVAYLFAGIFICIIPVMAMLDAGPHGPFAPVTGMLTQADGTPAHAVYFWATGLLSSFLDNAPTYLVFFHLAGGDAHTLMGPLAKTLTAISLGAVFMGAATYIGNAPNFMVYAIARRAGMRVPSFFAYMIWSGAILLPLFAAVTWLFLT
jgi:Na+/H+ antiporter NhaD/arsenite permease-like protein/Tfp pilus assembly protein PilF